MIKAVLPYGRQCIESDDIDAVARVLQSDFLTTGPEVEAFEAELATACGAKHAIVVSSGTAALHCAYAAAGVGNGHEIVTSPLTFSATANMALVQGARPVFADVDDNTLCLDPTKAERAITSRTKALVPVDFAGYPADMDAFRKLASKRGLVLIEDAAHSIGSHLKGRPVGSLADLTVFSFHPVKTITTGEGGAVLTNDSHLAGRARAFRNHGLVRDASRLERFDGPWYYEIQSLGLNYRLTAIQCALGRTQLRKLQRFVARRAAIVECYRQAFSQNPRLKMTNPGPDADVAWHLFTLRVQGGATKRAAVFAGLQERRIAPQVHYICVNDMPLYKGLCYSPADTPVAWEASQALLSLPLYPAMTDNDVARVVEAVCELCC